MTIISLDSFGPPFSSCSPSFLYCAPFLVLQDDFGLMARPFPSQGEDPTYIFEVLGFTLLSKVNQVSGV